MLNPKKFMVLSGTAAIVLILIGFAFFNAFLPYFSNIIVNVDNNSTDNPQNTSGSIDNTSASKKPGYKIAQNLQAKMKTLDNFWSGRNTWIEQNISSDLLGFYIFNDNDNLNLDLSFYYKNGLISKNKTITLEGFNDSLGNFYSALSNMDKWNKTYENLNDYSTHDYSFSILFNDTTGFALIYKKDFNYLALYEYALLYEPVDQTNLHIKSIIEGNYTIGSWNSDSPYYNAEFPVPIKIEAYMRVNQESLMFLEQFFFSLEQIIKGPV
jgi:hypothetical protein